MDPETTRRLRLPPGTLWGQVVARTARALRCGALHSVPTEARFVADGDTRFLVRVLSNLARKDAARQEQERQNPVPDQRSNPFLPCEEDLFVADLSDSHLCVLNKFNVVAHHLLVVTRAFEEQEALLTLADFEALWVCLREYPGLGFYNAGQAAGASQRHKHLQVVPLPLAPSGPRIPVEPLLRIACRRAPVGTAPGLRFTHALARLSPQRTGLPGQAAREMHAAYHAMRAGLGLRDRDGDAPPSPYNLLATREWLLLVPRSRECFAAASVNALGFAGALLVRDREQLRTLERAGPWHVLQQVAGGAPG